MKVLVTGSAGFIGSALSIRLLDRGDTVIGVDLSWPNSSGATYINCIAKDNRKNWEIDGVGGGVIDSKLIDSKKGRVLFQDDFKGASSVTINGVNVTNKNIISVKSILLLKYYIAKIFGMETNPMYEGIQYGD